MNEAEESLSHDSTNMNETESDDSEDETDYRDEEALGADSDSNASCSLSTSHARQSECESKSNTIQDNINSTYGVEPIENSNVHYANVAVYVEDSKTNKVYGVTNKHVTVHAGQTHIKMKSERNSRLLGSSINKDKTLDTRFDVGLIEIDCSVVRSVINKETNDQHVCFYNDSFDSIFGKEVFKYKPIKTAFELSSFNTPDIGTIVSETEHDDFYALLGKEYGTFLVEHRGSDFSVKGESGTALAIRTSRDTIQLVGIICSGFGKYTVCQFLPTVITYLEKLFKMRLELYDPEPTDARETERNTSVVPVNINLDGKNELKYFIPPGVRISFLVLTPEQIAPLNFDLASRALELMCVRYGNIDMKGFERLLEKERMLSLLVSKREKLQDCSVFRSDKPDYVAIEKGMVACDFLYKGRAKEAETCLKEAISCILKIENFGMRMLSKLTTYITWFCLSSNTTNNLVQLKELLDEGISIFEDDFIILNGFPKEALGYMYFDYSRYYMTKYDNLRRRHPSERSYKAQKKYRRKATEKAILAVNIFQQDDNEKKTKETQRRLVLAKCQLAYVLLGCGHDFNVIIDEIPSSEIEQAENIVTCVQKNVVDTPLVQNVDFLITSCDLQFRKGCMKEAIKFAKMSLQFSQGHNYCIGFLRAKCRLKYLMDLKGVG